MTNEYQTLTICVSYKLIPSIEDGSEFDAVMPNFNRWLKTWLDDFLKEDYEEVQLSYNPLGVSLIVPVNQIHPDIAVMVKANDDRSRDERLSVLFSSVEIEEHEFQIIDCYMA